MKNVWWIFAIMLFSLSDNWIAGEEREMIEGTWLPVEAELGGQPFPAEVLKTMKLLIQEGRYTAYVGEKLDKGTVKTDSSTTPKAMDITGTEGPNQGRTFLAIYEIEDESMRICYDLSGTERPTAFETKPDTQQFLVTYQRQNPN